MVTMNNSESASETAKEVSKEFGNIFTDSSRLNKGYTGSAVVWKMEDNEGQWNSGKYHLGNRKERYDAEVYAIAEALQAAIQ
jgi:hypothetical protein